MQEMSSQLAVRSWQLSVGSWLRWLSAAACCCLLPAVQAQTKSFSSDQALFLEEMTSFLEEADKKEARPFIERTFAPSWNGTFFTPAQRIKVVEVANFMLKKRFEAFPAFHDYLAALAAFANSGRSAAEFEAWMSSLEQLVHGGRKKTFADFIAVCAGLFDSNTLYGSASTTWKSSSDRFTFAFDSIPSIVFGPTDLKCLAKGDSAVIRNTTGVYYPTRQLWKGRGGRITWERAGLKPTATFAEWDHDYEVKVKSATFQIDTVMFNDPYFEKTLIGTVTDKVLANVTEERATYPRFEGYDRRLKIRDIAEGIDFEGGFTMQGAKLQGYGTKEEPAYLTFYKDKLPFIITSGTLYTIEPERIASDNVSVVIHLDRDSITHSSLTLRFLKDKRLLTLVKTDEGLSKSPFYDTYHRLDMHFESLTWKQGDPLIEMGNLQGSTQTRATFDSFNLFRQRNYEGMMGIDEVHPLVRVKEYAARAGEVFSAQEFAAFTRLSKDQVIPMLIDLATKGFVDYDIDSETVRVEQRLKDHIMASAGKIDYDVLQFNSNYGDGANATLNLLNFDLALKGVARIVLSDSQDVTIYPKDQLVTVKKDRDFTFAGKVSAGKLNYFGKEYYFHYDPFIIDLLNVDSVSFYADSFEKDEQGRTTLVRVKNVLENVTGTLEIDAPTNKNGLQQEKYPEFPKFNSAKESYVFYDRHAIQKGVYGRDRFYYRSDPFQIDSLDNFTNKGLNFTGVLVSAGIFPDIREPLRLQEDYSLGFVRPTGAEGLPLYGRKATFTNTVTLNYNGLQGDGDLSYLTTDLSSKQLVFTPDSTFGIADTLSNTLSAAAPLDVPGVHGSRLFVRLEPGRDVLLAQKTTSPMTMYEGQAFLHGRTELTPGGMTGAGLVDFTNATLKAKLFDFKHAQVHSDTSDFRLTEGDTASIAFRTDNVNSTIKLDERIGEFVSNGDETKVEFPVNQYICFMDRFKWYMDAGDISLESDRTAAAAASDLQLSGPNFISVHPDQDSLSFMAPKARYDLKKHLITADEVTSIPVADALISPDSARVRIRRDAAMDPLEHAVITANYVTKHHTFYNASVRIHAKRNYSAAGDIDYLDENKRVQTIHMESIGVDTSFQTKAFGRVAEEAGFTLSPFFDFQGQVLVEANYKEFTFTGATRIQHGCSGLERNWMGFSARIDPMEIYIPVGDSLQNEEGWPIGSGLYLTRDDPFQLYGTFLGRKRDAKDPAVIAAGGLLFFDKAKKEYVISNKDKIRQRALPGDLVSLDTENCRINADGRISSGLDLGRVILTDVGTLVHDPAAAATTSDVVMMADFHFLENALEKMAEKILAHPEQKQVDLTKTNYERAMREVLGLERSDKLISELSIKGEIKKLPDELVKAIVLCQVKLKWDGPEQSWISDGPLGIGTIMKRPVFRQVKGRVVLERKRSGDTMTILLMLDDQTYWFFQYARNYLYAYSSDTEFNTMIGELKEDRTVLESKKDEPAYRFILTNKRKVDDFRDRFGL